MVKFKAIGVSEGLAKAKALVIKEEDLSVVKETVADVEAECKRVLDAVEKAKQQIEVPVSYTHLDVYKRQVRRRGCTAEPEIWLRMR